MQHIFARFRLEDANPRKHAIMLAEQMQPPVKMVFHRIAKQLSEKKRAI